VAARGSVANENVSGSAVFSRLSRFSRGFDTGAFFVPIRFSVGMCLGHAYSAGNWTGTSGRSGITSRPCSVHGNQRFADIYGVPCCSVQLGDGAGVWAGYFHHRLCRFHFGDGLVDFDLIAHIDQPVHQLGIGQSLAQVREVEYLT
jgi:hypothetical protein